mmetsp:Transcript_9199/g.23054  ORF Transcript_9199/g.23054 Transcript_9199/m.23054 type:complete len:254 (+) Transcript_9199:1174-1935(+)
MQRQRSARDEECATCLISWAGMAARSRRVDASRALSSEGARSGCSSASLSRKESRGDSRWGVVRASVGFVAGVGGAAMNSRGDVVRARERSKTRTVLLTSTAAMREGVSHSTSCTLGDPMSPPMGYCEIHPPACRSHTPMSPSVKCTSRCRGAVSFSLVAVGSMDDRVPLPAPPPLPSSAVGSLLLRLSGNPACSHPLSPSVAARRQKNLRRRMAPFPAGMDEDVLLQKFHMWITPVLSPVTSTSSRHATLVT